MMRIFLIYFPFGVSSSTLLSFDARLPHRLISTLRWTQSLLRTFVSVAHGQVFHEERS